MPVETRLDFRICLPTSGGSDQINLCVGKFD